MLGRQLAGASDLCCRWTSGRRRCEPFSYPTTPQQPAAAFAADVWALGILIWRLRYPDSPPPTLAQGAAGLVPPASQPPQQSHASASLSVQRDAQLRECLSRMLRADPSERPSAAEILAHPLPLPVLSPVTAALQQEMVPPATYQIFTLQQEVLRLRKVASSRPPARCALDLANLPNQLLEFVGNMRPDDLFSRIELTLAAAHDSNVGPTGVVIGSGSTSSGHSLPLEHALSLFWRAALSDLCGAPLLHVPPPPLEPDPTPGLPPDSPLLPLDTALDDSEGGGSAWRHEALGRLLLLHLAHCVPLPSWLPPHIFKALLGRLETLDLSDLQAARPRTACRCALVLSSVVGPEFEWVDQEMPPAPLEPPYQPPITTRQSSNAASGAWAMETMQPGQLGQTIHHAAASAMQMDDDVVPAEAGSPAGAATTWAAAATSTTNDSKMRAARRVVRWRLLGVRSRATHALASGFTAALPPSLSSILSKTSLEALMLAGCAGRDLSAYEISSCIHYEGWADDEWSQSGTPALFDEWLHSIEPLERRRFVLLVTGRVSPSAPQRIKFGGTASGGDLEKESGLITVRYAAASVRLPPKPRALRASWELLLPSYSDQATLAAALLKMMENTPEGSHFDFSSLGEARRELS